MSHRKHPSESIDDEKAMYSREAYQTAQVHSYQPIRAKLPNTPMTRMRRISIYEEHTEVTISVTETSAQAGPTSSVTVTGEPKPPNVCPDCGAPWLPNFQDAVRSLGLSATQLKAAASEGRLHLFCSPQNEIWICERSIQQMRENS
jgi:hypothetical protein